MKVKDIDSGSLCTIILAESGHVYQWTIGKVLYNNSSNFSYVEGQ